MDSYPMPPRSIGAAAASLAASMGVPGNTIHQGSASSTLPLTSQSSFSESIFTASVSPIGPAITSRIQNIPPLSTYVNLMNKILEGWF
jgi:hypothetical protein